MTCQELRLRCEDPLHPDAEFRVETEHLIGCVECSRFVDARRQLGAGLRRLREALPQFPSKLDATILANYRQEVRNRPSVPKTTAARDRIAVLCVTGAAAAMILAVVLVFLVRPRGSSPASGPYQRVAVSQSITEIPTASFSSPRKNKGSLRAHGRRSTVPVVVPQIPRPTDFRSLLYCDELSCGGVMDVIRMQLPSTGIGPEPASTAGGGTVIADVLVGPDGIARGIRIVE